jgi:hypothetical protein
MEYLIEVLIYLFAIFGIIFTSISFYEMYDFNKYIDHSYRIFSKRSKNKKNVEIIVRIQGYDEISENKLIEDLKKDNVNLKEISNSIVIEK